MSTTVMTSENLPQLPIVFLAVWSASDDPKVVKCKEYLEKNGIFVFDGVKSIHRTPHALEDLVKGLPDLPPNVLSVIGSTNVRAQLLIGGAGWAGHLPWWAATHNPHIPVIALPVWSDTFWQVMGKLYSAINAWEAMHDMPPEVTNGVAPTPLIAGKMAEKIIRLDISEGYNKVAIPDWTTIDENLLTSLGLEIDRKSPIQIVLQDIDNPNFSLDSSKIQIIIPTGSPIQWDITRNIGETLGKLNAEWLYMWWQMGDIKYTNALIFAAQILASHGNDTLKQKLIDRRTASHDDSRKTDIERERVNTLRLKQIMRLYETGLWPTGKTMNFSSGDEQLETLGYVRFYTGKNADLYIIPDRTPLEVLMVRTDRTSVFNIPLDLEITGKWAIQNQISLLGAKFAESQDIRTAVRDLPTNIPKELTDRCQAIELCRQLEVEVNWKNEWMELIFRNYITGTLFKAYKKWENPYGIVLPENLTEWSDIRDTDGNAKFTPTDKTKHDNPIKSEIVRNAYPEIVEKLTALFQEFTAFAYERGYVIVDTKFEVFQNSKWEWVLTDEILTPESSRFIKKEDFEACRYISADKQIIRNIGKEFKWEERFAGLKAEKPDTVEFQVGRDVTEANKAEVLAGYTSIFEALTT